MQRISSLATLIVFMFMLSWVAQALQQEPLPLRINENSARLNNVTPRTPLESAPERITRPSRNGATLPVPDETGEGEVSETKLNAADPSLTEQPEQRVESVQATDGIHFLLVGRSWENPTVEMLMVVTLIPGSCAHLTSVDPSLSVTEPGGAAAALEELLDHGGSYRDLMQAVAAVTGLDSRFYIDLNRDGFIAMIEILGGLDYTASPELAAAVPVLKPGTNHFDGDRLLQFMENPDIKTAAKEAVLIELLINARDIQETQVGLSLLWTGYRNIRTDLGLGDLLDLRRISQQISPKRVTLTEIKARAVE